jgi:hypothetical protein
LPILSIKITRPFLIVFLITLSLAFLALSTTAHSEEGITWNRVRLQPALSVTEKYSDNIFLSHQKRLNESITTISPHLLLDFAISPDKYMNITYNGYYRLYRKTNNFKKDIHKTEASWKWITPKGSILKIGAAMNLDSIQPYSLHDEHKDFFEKRLFAEAGFEAGAFVDMGMAYDRTVQRFKKTRYNTDDFNRDTVTLKTSYKRLPDMTIVSEYSYFFQNSKDRSGLVADLGSHVVFIGAQWDPSKKLYGHIKSGYYQIHSKSLRSSGLAMDTDIGYRLTDIILLNLVGYRRAVTSTRTARESGAYYISTGGGLKVSYSGLQTLVLTATVQYKKNKFKQPGAEPGPTRQDDYFDLGVGMAYNIREWCSFITNYHYRVNNSSVDEESFRENMIEAQLRFAL